MGTYACIEGGLGSCVRLRPQRPNHVWSYDFVHENTPDVGFDETRTVATAKSARRRALEGPGSTMCVKEVRALQSAHDGRRLPGVFAIHPRSPDGDRDPSMSMGERGVRNCHVEMANSWVRDRS